MSQFGPEQQPQSVPPLHTEAVIGYTPGVYGSQNVAANEVGITQAGVNQNVDVTRTTDPNQVAVGIARVEGDDVAHFDRDTYVAARRVEAAMAAAERARMDGEFNNIAKHFTGEDDDEDAEDNEDNLVGVR